MSWTRKLTPSLLLKDGRELKTVSDARDLILGLPDAQRNASCWRHAADLLRYAAEDDREAIDDVRAQLSRALHKDGFI